MAYDVKSKEFANAWRIVSETLLAMIQQGEFTLPTQLSTGSNQGYSTTDKPAAVDAPTNEIPASAVQVLSSRTPTQMLYCTNPQKNDDGSYSFRRMQAPLSTEKGSGRGSNHFYRIFVYEDDSCEFELCPEVATDSESLQNLRDSADSILPDSVCQVVDGSISGDVNSIKVTCRGKGRKSGRNAMAVDTPCKVAIS